MKYLYHRPDDGGIVMIAHDIEPGNPNPYIEIDDSIANDFFAVKLHLHQFVVTPEGTLKNLYPDTKEELFITDKVYAVPRQPNPAADLSIVQDCKNKTISVQLNAEGLEIAQLNRFQNQSHCLLVACVPADPHLYLWHWSIPVVDFYDGLLILPYTGTDQIQFYTKKIFRSYAHDQLN